MSRLAEGRAALAEAGFARVDVREIDGDIQNLYYLARLGS